MPYHHFHSQLLNLKKLFLKNGCPEIFLEYCFRVFLDKLFNPSMQNSNMPDKTVLNISLPFTGSHSLQIRTQIVKLCSSAFPHVAVRFISQSGRRMSGLFSLKDRIPKSTRPRIIYKYSCQCCTALYFGQMRRHFHTRISEHMGVSPLTGKNLQRIPFQAFLPTLINLVTISLLMISVSSLLVPLISFYFISTFLSLYIL